MTLAVVTGAHGIGGEVRLKLFTDDLSSHRAFNGGRLVMERYREGIARFVGVGDRTSAEALRGTELTVPRASLPPLGEGEYYHADLIGLAVVDENGAPLGSVAAVENFGAGDLLDIERPAGGRFMVPVAMSDLGDPVRVPVAFAD